MKPIEYFLDEEAKYIESRKGEPEFYFDEKYGVQPTNVNDPLAFLERNMFHKMYSAVLNIKKKLPDNFSYRLTDSEWLMLLSFEGFLSEYFRDDYWGKQEIPQIVRDMQDCLYSAINKAPIFTGTTLYRFCVPEDKIDFEEGQHYVFTYSLTTTCENWDKESDRYIITPLPNKQTRAHNLYEIHNHGDEKQVNFLPRTSFVITKIKEITCRDIKYKHIYMNEELSEV